MKLAVSILKSKFDEKETIRRINNTTADYIHVDVMDGHFVLEKSKPYEFLHTSKKKLDVHLMVANPFNFISKYSFLNTESITIPIEIDEDINGLIEFIKARGLKAGLSISPDTKVSELEPYLGKIDEILVMSVYPGKGGQKFMESVLYKIDLLEKMRKERKNKFTIKIDGGINDTTIMKVSRADAVVCGSFICMEEDFQTQIDKLNLLKKCIRC